MCKNGRDGEQGVWREGRLTDQLYSQELARPSEAPSPHPSRPESPRFGDAANATTSESNGVIIISNSDKNWILLGILLLATSSRLTAVLHLGWLPSTLTDI